MEATISPNVSENLRTTTKEEEESQNKYMRFFYVLTSEEAQTLVQRVRIDGELHEYISKLLYAVRDGGKVLVPHDFPITQKPLKAAIKKVSRGLDIPVRFDKATDGGFIVRQASVDEAVQGDKTGERLGEARRKK
jgi:hypothetical protein